MLKNEIITKGKSFDLEQIKKLIEKCQTAEECLENEKVLLVLDNEIHMRADVENIAVPFHNKAYSGEKVLTYSSTDNRADIVALNLQSHEKTKSFELLYGFEMGRIFIDKSSKFDMYTVMCVASALIAGQIPVKRVIQVLNNILKNCK